MNPKTEVATLSKGSQSLALSAAMVLEATFIVIDNSDWMRNSDFAPSRLDAQQDAVNLLAAAKYAGRERKSSARLASPLEQPPQLRSAVAPDLST